jgi:hypothetical protein
MTRSSVAIMINEPQPIYSDLCTEGSQTWIQNPISRNIFNYGNQIIDGLYMQVKPFEASLAISLELAQEFAAWDAASDEALLSFERGISVDGTG